MTCRIFGLQAARATDTHESLAQIASAYGALLRDRFRDEPFTLAGWSFGGVIAFEVARLLERAGHAVARLVLIDSLAPQIGRPPADESSLARWFFADFDPEVLSRAPPAGADPFAALFEELRAAGRLPRAVGLAALRESYAVFRRHVGALASYVPERYPGAIDLIVADAVFATDGAMLGAFTVPPDRGWSALAGEVHRASTPGTHYSVLTASSAKGLAIQLLAALGRA